MATIDLRAGRIEYLDSGSGPVIVFVHGLIMDATVWDPVIDVLDREYRCIAPTLPLGSHTSPMRPNADLSMRGVSEMLAEFLEALDLRDVTLVVNDWGGPILTAVDHPERIARLVLTPCEAFDNVPPGIPGKMAALSARLPFGIVLAARLLRTPVVRQLPFLFGWMAKRPIPDAVFKRWTRPALAYAGVRRDVTKYIHDGTAARDALVDATQRLRGFDRPALIVWSSEDRMMPRDHGRALAALMMNSRLVVLDDAYVLVQRDRPDELVRLLREFIGEPSPDE